MKQQRIVIFTSIIENPSVKMGETLGVICWRRILSGSDTSGMEERFFLHIYLYKHLTKTNYLCWCISSLFLTS